MYYRNCPYHGEYKIGYVPKGCPKCRRDYEMGRPIGKTAPITITKEDHMAAMSPEAPQTKIEKFLEAAAAMKEKNKKMQRAAKMLKKNPELANLLEEISKFQF